MAAPDPFDSYFRRADADGDGRISGQEAISFFQGANLSREILAKVRTWMYPLPLISSDLLLFLPSLSCFIFRVSPPLPTRS